MPSEWENNSSSSSTKVSSSSTSSLSASSSTATSPEPNANGNNNNDSAKNGHEKDCALKASTMSHDPTPYVARARVTRPTPPKPSCNPMQFVQIKPCNLYQSAQQQLKKAEEIKKVKEVMKEEPEDWQNNLDNWKSSRRKRVEHIIERVVETKKLEEEEHDRMRRKSKTFSEMMEERGERGRGRTKLQSLASYNEDEANDLSDLGIGTSSASGKSSISEDCEVHSIVSEPAEVETLSSFDIENNSCQPCHDNDSRDRISSPGYETSSTAPVASPDPYEYTYEGAIEDYKSRVSKATASSIYKKPAATFGENSITRSQVSDKKPTDNDDDDTELSAAAVKMEDLPKIDISKKRELFEKPEANKKLVTPTAIQNHDQIEKKRIPSEFANVRSIKDRLCSLEKKPESIVDESTTGILSAEAATPSIKERLQCLEKQNSVNPKPNIKKVVADVVAVPPLKDRLSSLQNAVTKEEVVKKPIVLVDEYQLEMLKNEDLARRQLELDTSKDDVVEKAPSDDSGINTTDEKIDHDPATTEDEDDEEQETNVDEKNQMHDEKVPPSASANDFQGEFDSSVSLLQLKSLNTPTVVSLVDKPVVIDVDGVGDKSKLVRSNDEVNHAQNLLKMFKLAFDEDDDVVVEESKVVDSKMNQKTQDSQASVKDTTVPWRKAPSNVNNSVIQASKIPQGVSKVEVCPTKTDQVEIEIHSGKEITDIVKKSIIEASKTGGNLKIGNNIVENAKKSLGIASKTSVFEKVNSVEDILKNDICKNPTKSLQNIDNKSSKNSQNINETYRKISESEIPTPKVDGESQNPSKTVRCNNRYGAKPHDLVSNLINDPESTKSIQSINTVKSQTPSPKVNVEAKASNTVSPKNDAKPNDLVSIDDTKSTQNNKESSSKSPTTETQNISKMSPINSRYGAKPHDLVSNLILNIDNSNKKSMIPVPSTSAVESPQKTPIYENVPPVGLKKTSTPLNNGRVEIFNSNSMPTKPKSPEVLPRGIKPVPKEENIKPGVQTKDFQQNAFNEFLDSLVIDDIEAWQPKIVAEQPKQSSEAITVENVPQSVSEHVASNHVESTSTEKIVDPKPIETPSTEKTDAPSNVPITQPSPLPIESCVDILQSFLAAERSHAAPLICDPIEKKSNQFNSDSFIRQETVVEVPCSKVDVKDLPDPNFIRTPCIDVICGGQSTPTQQRESVSSSAGDSSPSSDITVIFKSNASPAPGSPTPNRSTLMQIANRVSSPIAGRRNPPTVVEQPCLKLDVKDLPDPNFIRTPCIDVEKKALSQCNTSASGASSPSTPSSWLHKTNVDVLKLTCNDIPNTPPLSPVLGRPSTPSTPTSWLHKTNADILKQTCDDISNTPPLSPVLGRHGSPTSEKPNFLIARVEVVETKIKVTTTNDGETPPAVPTSPPPPMTVESPKPSRKSALTSKPKNIFEFLKKNFQSKPDVAAATAPEGEFKPISVDNSKFYIPSDVISGSTSVDASPENPPNNGVNIEIIKTITTDSIVEQSDSQLNLTDEINDILDEEISKLVVEDANL